MEGIKIFRDTKRGKDRNLSTSHTLSIIILAGGGGKVVVCEFENFKIRRVVRGSKFSKSCVLYIEGERGRNSPGSRAHPYIC